MNRFLCLDDFEAAARRRLPKPLQGYVAGSAERGATARANLAAFDELAFLPRNLVDTSGRSIETELLGVRFKAPFGLAPIGLCGLLGYDADVEMARAAASQGIPFILSGASVAPLEKVAAEGPTTWFQTYLPMDPAARCALLERVSAAGVSTLVVTVDVPVTSNREDELRSGYSLPIRPDPALAAHALRTPGWLLRVLARHYVRRGPFHLENMGAGRGLRVISRDPPTRGGGRDRLTWQDIADVRRQWTGKLIVKGVLAGDDGGRAVQAGADAVIVSNHGGRQLDGSCATLRALPRVVEACRDVPVLLDGGVRRGGDILKALGLGAAFVFLGRPFAFAVAAGGGAGVHRAIDLLKAELDRDIAMLGLSSPSDMSRSYLTPTRLSKHSER